MGWLIAIVLLAVILLLPLGVDAGYDEDGAKASVFIGPLRRTVYPAKKKTKQTNHNSGASVSSPSGKKGGGSVTDFVPFVRLVLHFFEDFRGKLRVNLLQLNVALAGDDPCDLGQNYGKACAAWANFRPHLERFLVIIKQDVKIQCDFESSQTLVTARIILTIRIFRVFSLGITHGIKIIKEYLQITKKRKGGA